MGVLWFLWEREQNTHRSNKRDKVWSRDWRKGQAEIALPGDSSYKPSPNTDTIMNDKKYIPKCSCHGCLWGGPVRALHIQRLMLAANHWTEHGVLNGGVGRWCRGTEGVYSPMGRTTMLATHIPQNSQGLNHQPRCINGYSQKCGWGKPCWVSVEGVVLRTLKAQ